LNASARVSRAPYEFGGNVSPRHAGDQPYQEAYRERQAQRQARTGEGASELDRLSRNLAFIATLMDSGVEFIAVDNPHANKLTVHIFAAVAQHEREI
jgi:hypothetical protein